MISNSKKIFFLIEGTNSFAAVYYSNYLFFYMKHMFGFGDFENLLLAALNGLVYTIGSWQGGLFAQKYGNFRSIILGISGLIIALGTGALFNNCIVQICVYAFWTVSICLIWPALESLVSENEHEHLSSMVGIYNVIWAGTAALAYFVTGMILEHFGMQSLFLIPIVIHILQITILVPLSISLKKKEPVASIDTSVSDKYAAPAQSKKFLHLAWLSNPFSYIAISTIIPLIPSIAVKIGLSTSTAGIICSIWMFARLSAFVTLWKWSGWHYRLRWLAGAFLTMILSFVGMLCAHSVTVLILSQITFGLSTGMIYYSSLYYAMHGSEEKGAHGGLHEAMIGSGLFAGPVFGAVCIFLIPTLSKNSGMPVNILLATGFVSLMWMGRFRFKSSGKSKKN